MNRHLSALELPKILNMLAEYAGCDDTKAMAREITPCATYREAVRLMQCTADAHSLSNRFGTPSIYNVRPCTDAVKRARVGGGLSMRELLDVSYILRTARGLITWKKQSDNTETALDYYFSQLDSNKPLEDEISGAILSEEEISDHASPELADIRRKIRIAGQRAREQLDKMIRSSTLTQ